MRCSRSTPCTAKKTVELITGGKNGYLIQVKRNQEKLFAAAALAASGKPSSVCRTCERSRGRREERTVSVYRAGDGCPNWAGLRSIVKVQRSTTRNGRQSVDEAYYISSGRQRAKRLAAGIRMHWSIENGLHWVKDVVLGEDRSKIRTGNAPVSMSIIRNIAINAARLKGYGSVTRAIRATSNDLKKLFRYLE